MPPSQVDPPAQERKPILPGKPLAFVNATTVTADDLRPALLEAAGGEVLADLVLEQMIDAQLAEQGLAVSAQALVDEQLLILQALSEDTDRAVRLLDELKIARGLGRARFDAMLRRNAGLRLLVADQVEVTEAAIKQAYLMRYGPRYRVRLLVTRTASEAADLRQRAAEGEDFADLAALHSIDPSAAQGGLLSPFSPADPQYPQALRNVLTDLKPGEPSAVVALSDRFALLALEDKIEPEPVPLADVKEALAESVKLRNQRLLMEQLGREMLAEAEVIVLDPTLKPAWERQREALTRP